MATCAWVAPAAFAGGRRGRRLGRLQRGDEVVECRRGLAVAHVVGDRLEVGLDLLARVRPGGAAAGQRARPRDGRQLGPDRVLGRGFRAARERGVLAHLQQQQLQRRRRPGEGGERGGITEEVARLGRLDYGLPGSDVVAGIGCRHAGTHARDLAADIGGVGVRAEDPELLAQVVLHRGQARQIGDVIAFAGEEERHRQTQYRIAIGERAGVAAGQHFAGRPCRALARRLLAQDRVGAVRQRHVLHRRPRGGDQGAVQGGLPARPDAADLLVGQQRVEMLGQLLAGLLAIGARIGGARPVGLHPVGNGLRVQRALPAQHQVGLQGVVDVQRLALMVLHIALEAQQHPGQQDPLQAFEIGLLGRLGEAVLVEAKGHEQGCAALVAVGIAARQFAQRPQHRQGLLQVRIGFAHLHEVDAGLLHFLADVLSPRQQLVLQRPVLGEADHPQDQGQHDHAADAGEAGDQLGPAPRLCLDVRLHQPRLGDHHVVQQPV